MIPDRTKPDGATQGVILGESGDLVSSYYSLISIITPIRASIRVLISVLITHLLGPPTLRVPRLALRVHVPKLYLNILALKQSLCGYFGAKVYTIWVHGPLG